MRRATAFTQGLGIGLGLVLGAAVLLPLSPAEGKQDPVVRFNKKLDKRIGKVVKAADKKGITTGGVVFATVVANSDAEPDTPLIVVGNPELTPETLGVVPPVIHIHEPPLLPGKALIPSQPIVNADLLALAFGPIGKGSTNTGNAFFPSPRGDLFPMMLGIQFGWQEAGDDEVTLAHVLNIGGPGVPILVPRNDDAYIPDPDRADQCCEFKPGDTVIVMFRHGDQRHPVVLGKLNHYVAAGRPMIPDAGK